MTFLMVLFAKLANRKLFDWLNLKNTLVDRISEAVSVVNWILLKGFC